MKKKKEHIDLIDNRYGLFMSEESLELDISYGRDYQKTDNVQYIILHKIDPIKTKNHTLYGQSKANSKSFMPPIKLNVFIDVGEESNDTYGGGLTRNDTGELSFGIYIDELEENKTDIMRGDIIEYNLSGSRNRFYEVTDANLIPDTMNKTFGGFKPYWRLIKSIPVKEDVILV